MTVGLCRYTFVSWGNSIYAFY